MKNINKQLQFMATMVANCQNFKGLLNVRTENLHFELNDETTIFIKGENFECFMSIASAAIIAKRIKKIKQPEKTIKLIEPIKTSKIIQLKQPQMVKFNPVIEKQINTPYLSLQDRVRLSKQYLRRQII